MSVVTESPVHSSSSDDFAAFLDAELDCSSSDPFPEPEAEHEQEFENERAKRRKVELGSSNETHGSVESLEKESIRSVVCTHPGVFRAMCIRCGQRVDEGSGVAFGYIHKDLRLGNDEIVRLRISDFKSLLRRKKLYLILDLDQTLLNSTRLVDMTPDEEYLKCPAGAFQGSLFKLDFMHMMTKLRPFVHSFLKEASTMFDMYIYTMGERSYAIEMAKLLDPEELYFSSRIISQADCTQKHQKGLDVVLGQENAVLILDDTEPVWQKHKENLILMERYHFFSSSCRQWGFNCKSLSLLKNDESESDGALAVVLKVLKRIHSLFYCSESEEGFEGKDVRQILRWVRREVLDGCRVVFSHVFPMECRAEDHYIWMLAERLGAACSREVEPSITHVVAVDPGTAKSRWAVREGKFLVSPRWIEASSFLWHRQPESNFPVS